MKPVTTALLSFGMSGRLFHAPFLDAHPGFILYGVWERSAKKAADHYSTIRSFDTLDDLLRDETIELVIVNTPNDTHAEYAARALRAGKHVVVEKPFTSTVAEAIMLEALAEGTRRSLCVYQNRRWDSDFLTIKKIIGCGKLGRLAEAEFHFDRFSPLLSAKKHKELPGPGTGVLHDLGAHLIDAALVLFGPPHAVFADLRTLRENSLVNDYMDLLLYYPELRVRLKSSYFVKEPLPAFILHGSAGSFIKHRADPQEGALQAGRSPLEGNWGKEAPGREGWLTLDRGGETHREAVPTEKGNYLHFYQQLFDALRNGAPLPVSAAEGTAVMRIIDAALESHQQQKTITLQ
jgi:scyllo-inositol 2-dehydrogenase (NADP+)